MGILSQLIGNLIPNKRRRQMKRLVRWALAALLAALSTGCATYTTPGAGMNIQDLAKADTDIADLMKVEPAAVFPARIAVARVQASGYYSHSNTCYGKGRYCVVTT